MDLTLIRKTDQPPRRLVVGTLAPDCLVTRHAGACRFVPLIGRHAFVEGY